LPDDDFQHVSHHDVPVAIVPQAGHSMSWENPSALAEALNKAFG